MGRGLVHVEVGGEHTELGVALLKAFHVLVQNRCRKLPLLAVGTHIVSIAHLQDDFMERLFLLAGADLLIVILYPSVGPGLFSVVPFQSLVKEFMVHRLDILLAVGYIQVGAFRVSVLGVEFSTVMVHRSLAHHGADCPFQINPSFLFRRASGGPLLLSAKVTQKHF